MKRINFGLILICILLLASCNSTGRLAERKTPGENYLADIDEFSLGNINCFAGFGISKAKVTDIYFYCDPRTNEIAARFQLGIDVVGIRFTYAERQKLAQSFETYLEAVQNPKLENRKPTKKNAFYNSTVFVAWGVAGFTHSVDAAPYWTNYEFIEENKPYFKLQLQSAPEKGKEDINSPAASIYLTPAQIRKIMEICDQNLIQQEVDRVLAEAYTFDSVDYFFEGEPFVE